MSKEEKRNYSSRYYRNHFDKVIPVIDKSAVPKQVFLTIEELKLCGNNRLHLYNDSDVILPKKEVVPPTSSKEEGEGKTA